MGLTAEERKKLFRQTLAGDSDENDESLISSGVQKSTSDTTPKPEPVAKKVVTKKKATVAKKAPKGKSTDRLHDLEQFFLVSKKIREVVDEEFGSDEKQITYTTGMYPRYVSLLKRMSKSVGISQGAILSAALCNMLASFPEDEQQAIIKDEVNEIW